MAKYLIQDIIPPHKKRGVPAHKTLPSQREGTYPKKPPETHAPEQEVSTPKDASYVPEIHLTETNISKDAPPAPPPASFFPRGGTPRFAWERWLPWLAGTGIVALAIIFGMNYFSGATVIVLPKRDTIPLDHSFSAMKTPSDGGLPYAVMKITQSDSLEVPATGEKTVTAKASGRIVVYNEQTVSQRLIKNTRFQSSRGGKIYRINESITVPKAFAQGGKITPGSITVTVYADEAGEAYNSDPDDFTLPGLKGGALFEKVYARSSGPLKGGASGVVKTVSEEDMQNTSDDLRVALETKLRTKARGDIAPSQIGFDQGIVIELEDPVLSNTAAASEDSAMITQEGTLSMVLFDRKNLAIAVAKRLVRAYNGEELVIKNLDALAFAIPKADSKTLWDETALDFTLKGMPELEWIVDEVALKKELLSIPEANFKPAMTKFSTIDRATARLFPFWNNTFPEQPEDIDVKIVNVMEE